MGKEMVGVNKWIHDTSVHHQLYYVCTYTEPQFLRDHYQGTHTQLYTTLHLS